MAVQILQFLQKEHLSSLKNIHGVFLFFSNFFPLSSESPKNGLVLILVTLVSLTKLGLNLTYDICKKFVISMDLFPNLVFKDLSSFLGW